MKIGNNKRKIRIVCGLILIALAINLPVILTHFYHEITGAVTAVNGSIDLNKVNLSEERVYLDGKWEFYWKKLIKSSPSKNKSSLYIHVPDEWSLHKIDGKKLTAYGYGSYRLILENLTYENPITVYIPDFAEAYRVYIDGRLTAESGVIARNVEEIFTTPKADLYPITLTKKGKHEVVIEVATTRFSGLYMTPVLGDYNKIVDKHTIRNSVRFILFGVALFAFFCLITLYILSIKKNMYSFWMPFLVFFLLLRIMLTTEFYSFWQPIFFFNLSYEATNELLYLESFILKYLLIYLVQEQCGITFNKKEKVGFFLLYIGIYLTYLITPQDIYNEYLSVYIPMLAFSLDIYLIIKIYLWKERLKKFGTVIFWGAILIIVGLAIDSYYINGKIYMDMSMIMISFFMVFLIIMVWVYAHRVMDLQDDVIVSKSRLVIAQKQITMQKEHYDSLSSQMNEIKVIKHDINHFVGVMATLAEEENFSKLKNFLKEFCEKARFEPLPIFCQHSVANSIIGYNYLQAKGNGIRFESSCTINDFIPISDSDLCIILGNALENAIYACKQMENVNKFVHIESRMVNNQRLIKVTNSYNGCLNIKDGKYISLKGGSLHGLGIKNMEKVVQMYGGYLKIEHSENVFTLMVAIPEI